MTACFSLVDSSREKRLISPLGINILSQAHQPCQGSSVILACIWSWLQSFCQDLLSRWGPKNPHEGPSFHKVHQGTTWYTLASPLINFTVVRQSTQRRGSLESYVTRPRQRIRNALVSLNYCHRPKCKSHRGNTPGFQSYDQEGSSQTTSILLSGYIYYYSPGSCLLNPAF